MAEILNFPEIEKVDKIKTQLALTGNELVDKTAINITKSNLEEQMEKLGMSKAHFVRSYQGMRVELIIQHLD